MDTVKYEIAEVCLTLQREGDLPNLNRSDCPMQIGQIAWTRRIHRPTLVAKSPRRFTGHEATALKCVGLLHERNLAELETEVRAGFTLTNLKIRMLGPILMLTRRPKPVRNRLCGTLASRKTLAAE